LLNLEAQNEKQRSWSQCTNNNHWHQPHRPWSLRLVKTNLKTLRFLYLCLGCGNLKCSFENSYGRVESSIIGMQLTIRPSFYWWQMWPTYIRWWLGLVHDHKGFFHCLARLASIRLNSSATRTWRDSWCLGLLLWQHNKRIVHTC